MSAAQAAAEPPALVVLAVGVQVTRVPGRRPAQAAAERETQAVQAAMLRSAEPRLLAAQAV
jgi:hypothetical protein